MADGTGGEVRIEYVEARRVLLDVFDALRDQLDAVVLVGAQAVYLRTVERPLAGYQPFTTDADLVVDPARLADRPPLGEAMRAAGFVLTSEPGIWEARVRRRGVGDIAVPVDLIVPMQVAGSAGRRSARLGGAHGKDTARKSEGLEASLVEHGPLQVAGLEPGESRSFLVNVAGEAALLVAKLHKLGDRMARPDRQDAKDAGDIYRLLDLVAPAEMAARLLALADHPISAAATTKALGYGDVLFGSPAAVGVRLGVEALRVTMPEPTVRAVLTGYWRALRSDID